MKKFIILSLLFYFLISSRTFSQPTRIIINSYVEKPFLIKTFTLLIELVSKDSTIVIQHPPNYKYDTLSYFGLDSTSVLNKIKFIYEDFKLISYSKYTENGILQFEFTTDFKEFIEPNVFSVKKSFYDNFGEIHKIEYSDPFILTSSVFRNKNITNKVILFKDGKINKEVQYNNNSILEIKTYYSTGSLNEITHFDSDKIVGLYEYYSINGEILKLIVYNKFGQIKHSFERYLGGFKLNGASYSDYGVLDD